MTTDDFDYYLPEELIAQTPIKERDASRLMIVDRKTGDITHKHFYDIIDYLNEGDALVLNNTKVLPARLIGEKEKTKAVIEVLLLKDQGNNMWECLVKPARRIHVGESITFGDGSLVFLCKEKKDEGICVFEAKYEGIFYEILDKLGSMPLPPYIHEKLSDKDRYQTVYAKEIGSAAAPTAGLHFTQELLDKISAKGIKIVYLTLHVGLGTFRPVKVQNIKDHKMHSEFYSLSAEAAKVLTETRASGKRVIAVGTTSTRTLETIYQKYNCYKAASGFTDIFLYPGIEIKSIDGLITNFHLPKSTLIMLVSAFASKDIILNSYNIAVKDKYRFFSFGDAMFLK